MVSKFYLTNSDRTHQANLKHSDWLFESMYQSQCFKITKRLLLPKTYLGIYNLYSFLPIRVPNLVHFKCYLHIPYFQHFS